MTAPRPTFEWHPVNPDFPPLCDIGVGSQLQFAICRRQAKTGDCLLHHDWRDGLPWVEPGSELDHLPTPSA